MDIDIDCKTSFDPTTIFDVVPASMVKDGELVKHPVGVYFQKIPRDKITGLSAIPYEQAEELGYFKIDFLHLSLLDNFDSKHEIRTLARIPPDWNLLKDTQVVAKLFQLANHFKVVHSIQPTSIQELADCIALIRPSKRHLISKYVEATPKVRDKIRSILYRRDEGDTISFRRGHAISYAVTIVLQLHLIKGGIM